MTSMPSVTVEQMKEVDRLMVEEFNIDLMQMMENAGRLLANAAIDIFNPKKISVLAGPGHNGADGIVAARYLHNKGVEVEVVLGLEKIKLRQIALHQLNALKVIGIPIVDQITEKPDLIMDCLLGYNTVGAPRGKIAELIEQANELKAPVLCCDNPSGLELSTGKWHIPAFENAVVLTLGLPKKALIDNSKIKKLYVGDLGIPPEVYEKTGVEVPVLFKKKDYFDI